MDENFAEAFIHKEHTVLGRRLRPFCLWHSFALSLIESPFAGAPVEYDFPALYLAVQICSRGYDEGLSAIRKGPLWLLKFAWNHRGWKGTFNTELSAFFAYMRDYRTGPNPDHFKDSDDEQESGLPFELRMVGRLMRHGGMTKVKAWETSLGEAIWLALGLMEADGARCNLLSPSHIRALKAAGHME